MIAYLLLFSVAAFVAYLIGSVGTLRVAGQFVFHRNLRRLGRGNVWISNFWRLFKVPGVIKLCLVEFVKDALPILFGGLLLSLKGQATVGMAFAGFCVVMGRLWPLFNRFDGCHACAALAIAGFFVSPSVGLAAGVVCLGAVWFSRLLTVGAVAEALIFIVTSVLVVDDAIVTRLLIGCAVLVLVRHIPLLRRVSRGKEERLSFQEDLTYKLDERF